MEGQTSGQWRAEDVLEIQQVILKYPVAIDTLNIDLFDDIFTPDAQIELALVGTLDQRAYRDVCTSGLPELEASHHHCGQPLVTIDGDTAQARTYFIAQHARNSLRPDGLLLVGGWYDDKLDKKSGRWLINHRKGTAAWWQGNPAVVGAEGPTGGMERSDKGRECPAWLMTS